MAPDEETDCRSEAELARLSNEELLDYVVAMREAGRPECAKRALAILAYGYEGLVHYMVADRVPARDVDDVAQTVLISALRSVFLGKTMGEFVNWLKVIARRRIADYHGGVEREPDMLPLADEHEEDEEIFGARPASEAESGAIQTREAFGRVLEGRGDLHRLVIRLYGPNELGCLDLSAAETAEEVNRAHSGQTMSEANVHKIWSRFREDVADELGLGGS